MAVEFDLSNISLSKGVHEIFVKSRANGYKESEPSNTVHFFVQEKKYDIIIDEVYVNNTEGGGEAYLLSGTNEPLKKFIDEEGNLVIVEPVFGVKMIIFGLSSNDFKNYNSPLGILEGQKITIYPYRIISDYTADYCYFSEYTISFDVNSQNTSANIKVSCNSNGSDRIIIDKNSWYWKEGLIGLQFADYNIETGLGTLNVISNYKNTSYTGVDFSKGVTIEILEE